MLILEKYILKENIKPFLTSLLVVVLIMLTDRIMDLLNLILEKHLGMVTVLKLFGLSLPFMLALAIPMAVLVASILSFGRLSTDNELVAFKSCGINIYKLMRPTVIAALLLSIFMIFFNNQILPETNHMLKNLMIKVNYRRPITTIQPGEFTEFKNYTIFAKELIGDELHGLIIYNKTDNKNPSTITAKRGKIFLANGGNSFKGVFYNGEMHERDKEDPTKYQIRTFKEFSINLPDLGYNIKELDTEYRSDREMSAAQMQAEVKKNRAEIADINKTVEKYEDKLSVYKKDSELTLKEKREAKKLRSRISIQKGKIDNHETKIREFQVEIYKKYALAFACLIFVLIGIPVGMMTRTNSVGMAFSVSSFVFLVYYVCLIGGEELADRGLVSPFWSMWISNVIFAFLGIMLVYRTSRDDTHVDLSKISDFFVNFLRKIKVVS